MRTSGITSPRGRAKRVTVLLSVGLLLAVTACKTAEDRPQTDPLDDPWLDAIEAEDEVPVAAATPAAAPGDEPTTAIANPEGGPEVNPDAAPLDPSDPAAVAAAEPTDSAPTEAAKLAGASVPSSKTPTAVPGQPEPAPGEVAPEPGAEPTPVVAPTPAVEPAPAPAPAEPPPPAPITMADYSGTFRYSGGAAGRQDLAEAIEFGANQVAAIIRGIARKRLTKTQIIDDEIKIAVSGDKVTFNWSNGSTMTCVIGGPKVSMSFKGDKYLGRVLEKGSKMVIVFDAPDAVKTLVYVLSSDRQRLTVHHKLNADQLDEPVTFRLAYTRK